MVVVAVLVVGRLPVVVIVVHSCLLLSKEMTPLDY